MAKKEWFEEWFNSPYYHLLYGDRNHEEAQKEIDSLLSAIHLKPGARVLDLACGKGRHAVHLAHLGFDVTGLDISQDSISEARKFEQPNLSFYQHDMRLGFRSNYFDAVLNLFTSFGYFKTLAENKLALMHIRENLKPGGILCLDYFNSRFVAKHLVKSEIKQIEHVQFQIKRSIRKGSVYKTIRFEDNGRQYAHQEKVQLLMPEDFHDLCTKAGLQIVQTFGNYDLSPFDQNNSQRFILIAKKA